ncbi:MAG: hypothetical protein ACI31E_08585 [Muribaculaceae bacterium]
MVLLLILRKVNNKFLPKQQQRQTKYKQSQIILPSALAFLPSATGVWHFPKEKRAAGGNNLTYAQVIIFRAEPFYGALITASGAMSLSSRFKQSIHYVDFFFTENQAKKLFQPHALS